MNIKTFFYCLAVQRSPKKYARAVRELDCQTLLADEPLCVKDRSFGDRELVPTDLQSTTAPRQMHKTLAEKYGLPAIACAETDHENILLLLHWLTANTFYNGAQMHLLTDNTLDILQFAFGKPFSHALNCRLKAIALADCLVAVGITAYPVCMCSAQFKNSHFVCRAYCKELKKWCVVDPSFGCWFSDTDNRPIDVLAMRDLFLQNKEPVIHNYNFNGTTDCMDVYVNAFLKCCLTNLSTWQDNSADRRDTKKMADRKRFNAALPHISE